MTVQGVTSRQNKEFLFCFDNHISLKSILVIFSRNLLFSFMKCSQNFLMRCFQNEQNYILLLILLWIETFTTAKIILVLCARIYKIYSWCLNYGKVIMCIMWECSLNESRYFSQSPVIFLYNQRHIQKCGYWCILMDSDLKEISSGGLRFQNYV